MQDPDEPAGRPDAGPPVRLLRAGGRERDLRRPLILVAVALAVVIVQPWTLIPGAPSGGTPAADLGAPPATAPPPPTPTPGPSDPYAELVVTCGSPSGWRAATLQRWTGRAAPIRTWIAVDPVEARGAADPDIPFVPVATDLVLAIGYCSPLGPEQPPQAAAVELWSVPDGAATVRLDGHRLEPVHANALGGLWLPPGDTTTTVDGATGWAPGRYAIRLVARSFDRWLGLEIVDISGLGEPSSPTVAPSAAPSP
jgi:hypothetical protein